MNQQLIKLIVGDVIPRPPEEVLGPIALAFILIIISIIAMGVGALIVKFLGNFAQRR